MTRHPGHPATVTHGSPCEAIARFLPAMFHCAPAGERTRVRTPYLYPDGGIIDLFVRRNNGGGGVVSDLGEATAWLRMQAASVRRSPRQSLLVEDAARTAGVELFKGALMSRFDSEESLAVAVQQVGMAAIRVSDVWFTYRTRAVESINDEVGDLLLEQRFEYTRGEKVAGRSGRAWTVDFDIAAPQRSSLVMVASTGNRSAAQRVSEHITATWHDLNFMTIGPNGKHAVTLVDDTADIWSEEHLNLMGSLSTLARWSDVDGFVRVLTAA